MKRYFRQFVLLKLTLLTLTAAALAGQMSGLLERMSLWSAWLSLLLFVATLAIGPWRLWSGAEPVTNDLLRRDLGIWTALTALIHFALGTAFSMNQVYMSRFVSNVSDDGWFFWGSIWGFVTGLLCLLLLLISNNISIQRLGLTWWKRLQRMAYVTFALTAVHGIYFQLLERRSYFLVALACLVALVIVAQCTGVWLYRRRLVRVG